MSEPKAPQQNDPSDNLWWALGKWVNNFYIGLILIAVLAASILIFMLMLDLGNLSPGTRVLFAGVAGIIGSCLAPLLDQQSYGSLKPSKGFDQAQAPRVLTQLLIYIAGGFGVSAAAFVITSALLTSEPGTSAND